MPYLYYDRCDQTGYSLLYAQHRVLLRTLEKADLVRFGEPCSLDCMSDLADGPEKCGACRKEAGLPRAISGKCDPAKRPPKWKVPWKRQGAAGKS